MQRVLVVSLALVVAVHGAANLTTLDDFFLDVFGVHIQDFPSSVLADFRADPWRLANQFSDTFPWKRNPLPLAEELLEYKKTLEETIALEFGASLEAITARSLYDDLNGRCSGLLQTPIVDLRDEPSNKTCVTIRLGETLALTLKTAVEAGLRRLSRDCARRRPALCSKVAANCTLTFEGRLGPLLRSFVDDANEHQALGGETPLVVTRRFVIKNVVRMSQILHSVDTLSMAMAHLTASAASTEPFVFENLIHPWNYAASSVALVKPGNLTTSLAELTWGIVRSSTGSVDLPCSYFREAYSRASDQFSSLVYRCYYVTMLKLTGHLLLCGYPPSTPLAFTTAPPVYVHSQCLCLASSGHGCGVHDAPRCLSVLLRDFQRQISYRPAVTYLDYAFKTPVPFCRFVSFLQIVFRSECDVFELDRNLDFMLSAQCFFKDLVNKRLNCSQAQPVTTVNLTVLCAAKFFMQLVLCEDEVDDEVPVPFYGAGDSTLVLVLTYVDVAVRVWTLVTYLLCSELRNLPGKLLLCYQVTALLRLLALRASLADLQMAVRLDVAMDLASTLWLTSYLHFLTTSIKALRPPDSLSPDEVRVVLLRYSLLGWALPTALSAAFFFMDEVLDSRVQLGQVLFVLCNYAALFGNLYMFFYNCHFYYDVKSSVRLLQRGVTARSLFAGLFSFALKTSVLSGAGITFRLLFTQIQGLEHVLGYYHALGALQGLLLCLLFGCNRQARVFWIGVFRRCHCTPAA